MQDEYVNCNLHQWMVIFQVSCRDKANLPRINQGGPFMGSGYLQKAVAAIAALSILQPAGLAMPAQTPSPAPAAAVATSAPEDPGWPRQISKSGTTVVYYQPQIDGWKDYKNLDGRVAFSVTPPGGKTALGVVTFHATTAVDQDSRTVYLQDVNYASVRFPSLDEQAASHMEQLFRDVTPTALDPIALDRLMADLD